MDPPKPSSPQSSHPGTLTLTPLATLTPPAQSRTWQTTPHPTLPIAATSSSDKSVRIYSLTSFTLLSSITGGHKRSVRTTTWKPGLKGQSVLATGSFDASVGLWRRWDENGGGGDDDDADEVEISGRGGGSGGGVGGADGDEEGADPDEDEEWQFALILDGHDSEVKCVAFSAGGNLLATCSRDKSVWIWEEVGTDDWETVAVLQEHAGDVKSVAWHPSEECVASASYDDEVRLWREDVDDWGCVAVLRGHGGTVWMCQWEAERNEIGKEGGGGGGALRWEGEGVGADDVDAETEGEKSKAAWIQRRRNAGPRLVTCSDDMSIRIWRKQPRDRGPKQSPYSIIRSGSSEEDWVEETILPQRHERAVYAVAWSQKTGLLASCSGDGKIVIYKERWKEDVVQTNGESQHINTSESLSEAPLASTAEDADDPMDTSEPLLDSRPASDTPLDPASQPPPPPSMTTMGGTELPAISSNDPATSKANRPVSSTTITPKPTPSTSTSITTPHPDTPHPEPTRSDQPTTINTNQPASETEWTIIAEVEGAHSVFEVNHVCWAPRADRGRTREGEEVLLSTGDDGVVKVWVLS
ncbi:Cytosolic iron-sulfur protein assembly protein [Agyrium rufum]|nr:Cytosolic iron-sulfur protein assembly protein [Agyrium rufum]